MIPAVLMGPLGKIVGVLVLVMALIGLGEWHGSKAVQEQWDVAVARQAMHTAASVIANAQNTAQIETKYEQTVQAQTERERIVTKEVIKYVQGPSKKCVESPEFVRAFDAVSGLHDAPADGVPASASSPGAVAVAPEAQVTDAEVLETYQSSVIQLFELWDTYAALVEWTRSSYAIAQDGAGRE